MVEQALNPSPYTALRAVYPTPLADVRLRSSSCSTGNGISTVLLVVRFWSASGADTRMLVSTTYVLRSVPAFVPVTVPAIRSS